ncbi:UPF0489 family protein [Pseudomonas sp. AA-38]|uniref:UPF0489 family protein n=1 Tax=Pseudomonas sp. AA-38 TaxID=3028807 RepID=UPI0023F8F260|nr:UPF0489 family protein [Pseudomonas sp. AA-38]
MGDYLWRQALACTWHIPLSHRGVSGHGTQNFLWQNGPVYIMDNHRAAWWCWLRHLVPGEPIDLFHIDRHTDTLTSNLPLWKQSLPTQMHGVSLQDYLGYRTEVHGFDTVTIRWDNYLSLFLEYEQANLGSVFFATHGDGDAPNLLSGSWRDIVPWELPANFDFYLSQGNNWIVNVDLDYFFCKMDDGSCQRFLAEAYVRDLCFAIKKNLDNGRIKVLTICLTPDDDGFSGGWASAETLCAEVCQYLGIQDFQLPS